jgi:hypothetical protein
MHGTCKQAVGRLRLCAIWNTIQTHQGNTDSLVEKKSFIHRFSPQLIRSTAKGGISPGLIENVGQGALVPVQICPLVPVCSTNRD